MPTSRLSTFVIDCKSGDLDAAAAFWAKALRRGARAPQAGDDRYRDLTCSPSEPLLMIQRVEHESRIHLDIESDDIDAEVKRLVELGAREIERVRTWVVMEAPTGQRFCVVRPQRPATHTEHPGATAHHATLAKLVGHFKGTTTTFFDPSTPPDVAEEELHVTSLFGGRWVRIELVGSVMGKPHAGEMTIGYHADAGKFEASWIDSFHTGSAIMRFEGAPREDGAVAVTGSYTAAGQTWGWRTEWHALENGNVRMRAFNIIPGEGEFPALDNEWQRLA